MKRLTGNSAIWATALVLSLAMLRGPLLVVLYAAASKLTALSELSVADFSDDLYIVDDTGPTSYKIGTDRMGAIWNPIQTSGRLTCTTGNAAPVTDVTSCGTLYYTDIGNDGTITSNNFTVNIFDGTRLRMYSSAQISLALATAEGASCGDAAGGAIDSGENYDVFLCDNAGTLTLELSAQWTNNTTRADARASQSGTVVKSGTTTRRWIGTIRANGSGTIADAGGGVTTQVGGVRYLWNAYNQTPRQLRVIDTTDSWAYITNTIRQANGATGNKVEYVTGSPSTLITAQVHGSVYLQTNSAVGAKLGPGIDSTTTFSGNVQLAYNSSAVVGVFGPIGGYAVVMPGLGYHYVSWNEKGADGTSTFTGDNGADSSQSGLTVTLLM